MLTHQIIQSEVEELKQLLTERSDDPLILELRLAWSVMYVVVSAVILFFLWHQ